MLARLIFVSLWVMATLVMAEESERKPSVTSARILLQSTLTAGLSHHDARQVWDELQVGDALLLVREASNPHDGNAVRVDWKGRTLGYLPRTENTFVARQLDRGNALEARITALGKYRNNRRKLEIKSFSRL
jgi:hypothetical protein